MLQRIKILPSGTGGWVAVGAGASVAGGCVAGAVVGWGAAVGVAGVPQAARIIVATINSDRTDKSFFMVSFSPLHRIWIENSRRVIQKRYRRGSSPPFKKYHVHV